MVKERKIPMRQCVGCREMHPKAELIRAVKPKEGEVTLDFGGKLAGRGAYICKNKECLAKAKKSKALERAFSCAISEAVYEELSARLAEVRDAE